jgi:trk system potassium uptake protein TrkH
LIVYMALTVAAMTVYAILGMPAFEAVVHGMATVATGGFSSNDDSFSRYEAPILYAAALFMFLASLPFIRFVQLMNGSAMPLWRDTQIRAYARWLGIAVAAVTIWRISTTNDGVEEAFRDSLFNLTSIMSSTGFGTSDFAGWGGFMLVVAFVIGVVGACSGSTAAGLSVFRVQLVVAVLKREIRRIGNPSAVDPIRYEGRPVEEDVLNALILFVSRFILILGTMSEAMTLLGVDSVSALFAVWTTLGNVGYGFGPMVERTGTFIDFPPGAIAIMTLCMILGRLGLLAILVMVLPSFWRR